MKHLKDHNDVIHALGPAGADYTLCGDAMEGENGDEPMVETDAAINCVRCIGTIRFCKKIRDGEMVGVRRAYR